MIDKLVESIEPLVNAEYERSKEHEESFHSTHEGAALIKEEIEEAAEQSQLIDKYFENLWDCVRKDEDKKSVHYAELIENAAMWGAAELIQVAAMARKYKKSVEGKKCK